MEEPKPNRAWGLGVCTRILVAVTAKLFEWLKPPGLGQNGETISPQKSGECSTSVDRLDLTGRANPSKFTGLQFWKSPQHAT